MKKAEEVRLRKLIKSVDDRLLQLQQEEQMIKDAINRKQNPDTSSSLLEMCKQSTSLEAVGFKSALLEQNVDHSNADDLTEDLNAPLDLDVPATLSRLATGGFQTLRRDSDGEDEDGDNWFDAEMNLQ